MWRKFRKQPRLSLLHVSEFIPYKPILLQLLQKSLRKKKERIKFLKVFKR